MRYMIIDNNINIYYFWSTCSTLQPLDHFFPFRFRHPVHHRRPANCAGESLPVRLTKAPSHSSLIDAERRKKKATKKKEGEHVFLCRIFFLEWDRNDDRWRLASWLRDPRLTSHSLDLTFAEQIMCVRRIGLVYVCMSQHAWTRALILILH